MQVYWFFITDSLAAFTSSSFTNIALLKRCSRCRDFMEMIDHIPNDRQGVFFGGLAALFALPTASWQPAVTAVLGSVYAKAKPRSSGRLAG